MTPLFTPEQERFIVMAASVGLDRIPAAALITAWWQEVGAAVTARIQAEARRDALLEASDHYITPRCDRADCENCITMSQVASELRAAAAGGSQTGGDAPTLQEIYDAVTDPNEPPGIDDAMSAGSGGDSA